METVTVSPKFQVVIPQRVRRERHIRPGDRMAVLVLHGLVHLVPIRPFSESKGALHGTKIRLEDVRDHSERIQVDNLLCVDTYGWLERLLVGPRAAEYNKVLTSVPPGEIVTSVVTVYEIYRKIRPTRGQAAALEALVHLRATTLVPVNDQLALEAADYSLAQSLHFSDASVYATARRFDARLHTSDPDLKSAPGVVFH